MTTLLSLLLWCGCLGVITGTFRAGRTSRVSVGANNLYQNEYTVTDHAERLDTTNFEDNSYAEAIAGIREATYTLKGVWDAGANQPYANDPPGLFPRDDGGTNNDATKVYTSQLDVTKSFYNFPLWGCTDAKVNSSARGPVTFEADCYSQGPYTDPSGNQKIPAVT